MIYRILADLTVVVHLGFIAFVAVGGLLAWRWPRLLWAHVPSVIWAAGIVFVGYDCPLTPLEKLFRRRAGEEDYDGGFVDRYVEGVIYPERYTPHLRALVAVAIVVGYVGVARRQRPWVRASG